jgi:O-6-methylguanine DNA methyltransferase
MSYYTIENFHPGRLSIGFTERGVSFIQLGIDDKELKERCPKAREDKMCKWKHDVLKCLEGEVSYGDIPLDVYGTEFQVKVWKELRKIPYGEVRTYSEIAEAFGDRSKVRAVANACGSNPVPFVIPCHRVIREDGSIGGYYYGTPLKEYLLHKEKSGKITLSEQSI